MNVCLKLQLQNFAAGAYVKTSSGVQLMENTALKQALKKTLSIFLSFAMLVVCFLPAFSAFADDGVIGVYDVQIFYDDGTLVPDYDDDGSEHLEYLMEGETLQLIYSFVDCTLPDNGYVKWWSDTPTVCDVSDDGLVRAYDSSKGAAVRLWLDNEVASIPLIGSVLYSVLEELMFNDYVDLDTMDTDEIVSLIDTAFGSSSLLAKYIDSYSGALVESLKEYLDSINTKIYITMYDSEGNVIAEDYISVCVTKSDAVYADFIPNGTHITNKSSLPTTVAVGSTVQLTAVTTPVRLNMGVVYSVQNSSIFSTGKAVATVNDDGLVTFKNTGTVTIVVSPDSEGFIDNLLKYVNYIYALDNTSTLDTDTIADILINYVGLDINRTVLTTILDACFAVYEIVEGSADPVQLTATAVEIIANFIYYFTTNDSITFNVVDAVPITDFNISGVTSVQEGAQIQLEITDVTPEAGDTSDITWTSSDSSIASVDPTTGIVTGRDAGGSLGSLSSQTVQITATSAANNVSKTVTITVTGKTGKYISDVEIEAEKTNINIGDSETLIANVYPSRVASASNLYIYWGVVTDGSDEDDYEYAWAGDDYETVDEDGETVYIDGSATDGIGSVDENGVYTAVSGGVCTVACRAVTGYYLTSDYFYTISEAITTIDIENGQPITSISLEATEALSTLYNAELSTEQVEIDGITYNYVTVKIKNAEAYAGAGCTIQATIEPEDATNKNLIWYVEGADADAFHFKNQDDSTGTVDLKIKTGNEKTQNVNVYCTSEDGTVVSDVLTVTVTRNYATGNTIDGGDTSLTIYQTTELTHSMTYSGSWDGGAYASTGANWYSSDEDILKVVNVESDGTVEVYGVDVGIVTLYCVSTDGGYIDSVQVTVYPDKSTLNDIMYLCENTVIIRTAENTDDYQTFMRYLDYGYFILYDIDLPSQAAVDTWAQNLLYIFYKLGGFISLNGISILDEDGNDAGDFIRVDVSTTNYKKTSYDLDYAVSPANCMYSSLKWTSSSSDITVTGSGVCTPSSNSSCYSVITVTATDYMGNAHTDSVTISFVKTAATSVSISPSSITDGKVGDTETLKATVKPTGTLGIGGANITDVIWSSSDESIATVDENGVVTFVQGGTCIITATTVDGGLTAECEVSVVTNYDNLKVLINTYETLSLERENYTPNSYDSFEEIMEEAKAMVEEASSSQAEVDAMYDKLSDAYTSLEKYNYITKIELYLDGEATADFYQYDLSVLSEGFSYKNATLDLNIRLYPNNANYSYVVWESSTDSIDVTDSGVCTPTANSSCYGMITATVYDDYGNSFTDEVWVSYAYVPVTGVTLSDTSIEGEIGDTYSLTCTLQPSFNFLGSTISTASIQDVFWESDDESVATVDQDGLVTFTGTGSTTIRVIAYDGGFSAECTVSTGGDRAALAAAVSEYESIDYQEYTFEYGTAFEEAYENAVSALTDSTLTQDEIDEATANLISAVENLEGHEFIHSTIDISYLTQYHNLGVTWKDRLSGTLENDEDTFTLVKESTVYNSRATFTVSLSEDGADNYESVVWSVDSATSNASYSISDDSIVVESSSASKNAELVITATATDCYGRETSRSIRVVITSSAVTGVSLDQTEVERYVSDGAFTLTAAIEPSDAAVTDLIWTSSNEDVATVEDGVVTPVEIGQCTITVETLDGGYTASCEVTLKADFSALEEAYNEYQSFVDKLEGTVYTSATMNVLQQALSDSYAMINAGRATQSEVDAMYETLQSAFDSLEYVQTITGVELSCDDNSHVSEVNSGSFRYTASLLVNDQSFEFATTLYPEGVTYSDVQWDSSNSDITVEDGVVTCTSSSAAWTVITVTYTDETGAKYSQSAYVSFIGSAGVKVSGISFDDESITGAVGETITLSPSVSSSNIFGLSPTITDVIYESSDEGIAYVDDSGVVLLLSEGEAVITAVTADGGYTAEITIVVTESSDEGVSETALTEETVTAEETKTVEDTKAVEEVEETEETEGTTAATSSSKAKSQSSSSELIVMASAVDISDEETTTAASSSSECSHTWDSGVVTKNATCTEKGEKTYTCTSCGATKTEKIDKISHSYTVVKKRATTSSNGTLKCSMCGATKTIYKIKGMSLSKSSYVYNGKSIKPTVTVKDSKGNKISSKYYTVSYIKCSTGKTTSSIKSVGKYYVKIKFKGRYSGSLKKTLTVKPKATSVNKIVSLKKGFSLRWNKVTSCTTGYQIQYSTSKDFSSYKTKTVTKNTTLKAKITGLKGKKKYYVRVRTYKTVKVNGKSTKIYSSWSKVKAVTTKK